MTPEAFKHYLDRRTPQLLGKYLHAAVMVLLFPIGGELHILYTMRALSLRHQPGDISFPGGRLEPGETPLEAALRETEEELGLPREKIQLLGGTDYMVTPFRAVVTPFVGFVPEVAPQELPFSRDEVETVFTVPISHLLEVPPKVHYLYFDTAFSKDFPFDSISGGKEYAFSRPKIPELFYQYEGKTIWGMTASITQNVIQLLQEAGADA